MSYNEVHFGKVKKINLKGSNDKPFKYKVDLLKKLGFEFYDIDLEQETIDSDSVIKVDDNFYQIIKNYEIRENESKIIDDGEYLTYILNFYNGVVGFSEDLGDAITSFNNKK